MMTQEVSGKSVIRASFSSTGLQGLPGNWTTAMIKVWSALLMCCFVQGAVATVWQCPSANFTDVNSNVMKASPGDTVIVPSGDVNWNQTLSITNKGIFLEGASYYLFP